MMARQSTKKVSLLNVNRFKIIIVAICLGFIVPAGACQADEEADGVVVYDRPIEQWWSSGARVERIEGVGGFHYTIESGVFVGYDRPGFNDERLKDIVDRYGNQLRGLDICGTTVTNEGIEYACDNVRGLEYVCIGGTVGSLDDRSFRAVMKHADTLVFFLAVGISVDDCESLEMLRDCKKIRELNLGGVLEVNSDLGEILLEMESLERVNLSGTSVDNSIGKFISEMECLEYANLTGTIVDEGIEAYLGNAPPFVIYDDASRRDYVEWLRTQRQLQPQQTDS